VGRVFNSLYNNNNRHQQLVLALAFGLIHGMGFANTIRFILAEDQSIGMGLFGFNVGLEAGQIVVVAIILLAGYLFINMLKINRREWVIFLSAGVFSLALKIALDRLPIKKQQANEKNPITELPVISDYYYYQGTNPEQRQFQSWQQV
jgi:uncharacterized membrane protein